MKKSPMPKKGMHMMPGSGMPMSDKEMKDMMAGGKGGGKAPVKKATGKGRKGK